MMAGIRSKDTKPEMVLRRGLHRLGFRYRLHDRKLPGKPDLVFPRYQAAVFVNGCFWHGHDCHLFKVPSTRTDFWLEKIGRNRDRDVEVRTALSAMEIRHRTVWECELRGKSLAEIEGVIEECARWLKNERG